MLQIRYEQKLYWRSPSSAMFTFLFPILLLVIFASLNYGATLRALGGISYNQYYCPGYRRVRSHLRLLLEPRHRPLLPAGQRRAEADSGNAAAALGLHGGQYRLLARGERDPHRADDRGGGGLLRRQLSRGGTGRSS
jgi:hypothetical protein